MVPLRCDWRGVADHALVHAYLPQGLGCRVQSLGLRVGSLGFGVWGLGLRV